MKKDKKIIRLIIFILVFLILLDIIMKLLWLDPTPISLFYEEPKNSIDVVYLGSSNAHYYFNSTLAYHLYGFTTSFLSAESQAFPFVKYCMKEAEKYQNPTLYVIDIAKIADTIETHDTLNVFEDANIRRTADSLRFSKNRIDAINEILSYRKDIPKNKYMYYYFSFFMYHNRWQEIPTMIKSAITGENKRYYKGYRFVDFQTKIEYQKKYIWSENIDKLDEENKNVLIDLINYIKTNNLNVLFVVPIKIYTQEFNEKINDAIRIIQENNLKVINFNVLSDFNNIDFERDMYNKSHLNVYGATKYTLYFAKYLKDNYNLENHKNDKKYSSWDKEYEKFKNRFDELIGYDFEDILLKYTSGK